MHKIIKMVEHSSAEEMLKGTQYLAEGSKKFGHEIKAITKSDGKRVITFKDGSKISTNKQTVRALVDVKLDKIYKPKALSTLKEAKTVPTTKVKLGGPKEGEVIKYASKANAKRAVDNYYSGDFQQYKRGEYPQRCKKGGQ